MKPLILFSLSNGWGVRNFIHSGLIAAVSQFADVGVATHKDLLPYFEELVEQGEISFVVELSSEETWTWRRIRQAKKLILQLQHDISTARIKLLGTARGPLARRGLAMIWRLGNILAAQWQLKLLDALEHGFNSPEPPVLPGTPDVFVNCSPFDFRDNKFQRSLHGLGVPAIVIIPSWDNPSTKGCLSLKSDIILTWGDHQKDELQSFYPAMDPACIRNSGIPQFDAYYQTSFHDNEREKFLENLAIPANKKVILYATCSEQLFHSEPTVVGDVVAALEAGKFGSDAHLLIRCHPADRSTRYEHLCASDKVSIFPSSRMDTHNIYSWVPPREETLILAETLRHTALCINTASTMTLDAIASLKPVVNVAYDGDTELPYEQSVRRFYDYHHYLPIARSVAVPVVHSKSELLAAICDALDEPDRLEQDRKFVFDHFCHSPKLGSVSFIVKEIKRLAQCSD